MSRSRNRKRCGRGCWLCSSPERIERKMARVPTVDEFAEDAGPAHVLTREEIRELLRAGDAVRRGDDA